MNYTSITKSVILGAVALVLGFFLVMPGGAQAQTRYGSGGYRGYNNYPSNPVTYNPVTYTVYPPISASCYAAQSSVNSGTAVQWVANVTGGTGTYYYTWSGNDGFSTYGYSSIVYNIYNNPGYKNASVTVTSNGQTSTVSCSGVNVGSASTYAYTPTYTYTNPTYTYTRPTYTYTTPTYTYTPTTYYTGSAYNAYYPTNYQSYNVNGLDIGCYADPIAAKVNQPVTWSAEVTGGVAPYTYAWTGSDGLTGAQNSILTYYTSTGSKSAVVTVTSADGKTASHACSNAVTVTRPYVAPAVSLPVVSTTQSPTQTTQTQTQTTSYAQPQNQVTQSSQTSSPTAVTVQPATQTAGPTSTLGNVPWGWVAILVILVLFVTVMYLLFNRQKI